MKFLKIRKKNIVKNIANKQKLTVLAALDVWLSGKRKLLPEKVAITVTVETTATIKEISTDNIKRITLIT